MELALQGRPGAGDLWGKFRDESRGGPAWHPLVDHCTDVACVLEALLRQPTISRRLARAGGLDDLDEIQRARLCFLAFIHDLGKCSLGFRAKAIPELGRTAGHLAALKPLIGGPLNPDLGKLLDARQLDAWAGEALDAFLLAVFAHHGRTPDLEYRQGSDIDLWQGWTGRGREPLRRLAELVVAGRTLFAAGFADGAPPLPGVPAFQHLFAGLLMLADWLGSAEEVERFPFAQPGDPLRANFVRDRAPQVLAAIGLLPPAPPLSLPPFAEQFPDFSPRAAQRAMDGLPLPSEHGSVVLLESETGSGKTEAALRWASRLIDAGLVDGCFFAVPLRSAAVQLHRRMQAWLDATYGEGRAEALLAVPGYYRMGEAEGQKLPDFSVQWSDAETEDRRSRRWAAEQPKRYAAASFAVGTIDQALLGALAVRHAHLRAACLVRHLLVIDEVHSSDVYMTVLTERLLTLFRAADGHVLLMSATVGAGTRERLVAQARTPPLATAVGVAYPRITASHAPAVEIEREGPSKTVRIEPCPLLDDAAAVVARVVAAVGDGARVLILRNTVNAAIATQAALETLLPAYHPALFRVGEILTLHHGRFAAEDRRFLDAAVEARFGKLAPRGPALVVATQTLEQSLDVDADLLVTDLVPIDVLLQRIGRLHRHARADRPDGFERACCVVLLPASPDLTPFLQRPRHGIGKERAYENLLAIEAARRLVENGPTWSIPTDNRRLVETGTHEERLRQMAEAMSPDWLQYWQQYRGGQGAGSGHARDVSIDFGKPFADIRWPDAGERLATRLGARDLLLPLDRPLVSPFSATLSHLKVPAWMAPREMPEGDPVIRVADDGRLQLSDASYRYDRFGLRAAP